jgi:hypothetical protein
MSQPYPDEVCQARNCREPRESLIADSEFCEHHQRQLDDFHCWLGGFDDEGAPMSRSFDFERSTWGEPRPSL